VRGGTCSSRAGAWAERDAACSPVVVVEPRRTEGDFGGKGLRNEIGGWGKTAVLTKTPLLIVVEFFDVI
jgi:hypothetical protein